MQFIRSLSLSGTIKKNFSSPPPPVLIDFKYFKRNLLTFQPRFCGRNICEKATQKRLIVSFRWEREKIGDAHANRRGKKEET